MDLFAKARWPIYFFAAFGLGLLVGPAWAMYKVVQPDGSVTYTDRPPLTGQARVTSLTPRGIDSAPQAALPVALRQAMQRYPVTLYTAIDCPPCEGARQLLLRRGVPFAEKRVLNEDDAQALERAVGGRTVPALHIGAQPLRGFSENDWTVYLDAAGYPRESVLPAGWPMPAATPLAQRAEAPSAAPAAPPAAPARLPAPPVPERVPGQIRF